MTPSAHPGWRQTRPDALTRELRLRGFDAAMAFVNQLAWPRPRKRSSRPACRPLTTAYRPDRGHDDPDAVAARDA